MKNNYRSTYSSIIQKFLQLPQTQKIFKEHTILCVHWGGSHLIGLNTEQSDIDLCFITSDKNCYKPLINSYAAQIQGIRIHGYLQPLETICESTIGYPAMLIKANKLSWDDIAWFNPCFKDFVDKYINSFPALSWIGMLRIADQYDRYMNSKNYYILPYGSNLFFNTSYSNDFILSYKKQCDTLTYEQKEFWLIEFDKIINKIQSTGDNWKQLWIPIYEKLKQTLH